MRALEANGDPWRFVLNPSKPSKSLTLPSLKVDDYYMTIIYIAGTSEPIKRVLAKFGIPKNHTRGSDYSIPCNGCDAMYVGETYWQLKTRLGEHLAVKKGQIRKSASAEHSVNTKHEISWDYHRFKDQWCILEAWEINIAKNFPSKVLAFNFKNKRISISKFLL